MQKSIITITDKKFIISHKTSSGTTEKTRSNIVVLQDSISDNNILTEIEILTNNTNSKKILFHWEQINYSVNNFCFYYAKKTNKLFIGGGKVSFCIDLHNLKIINEQYNDCMIWEFQEYGEFVIELGELNCFLYNKEGELLSKCSVVPPYEIEYHNNGIKFKSPDFGATWLHI